jgi:hypothetical protein
MRFDVRVNPPDVSKTWSATVYAVQMVDGYSRSRCVWYGNRYRSREAAEKAAAKIVKREQRTESLTCRGGRDGECSWKLCPQLRDNEPMKTGRHCPLDADDDEI